MDRGSQKNNDNLKENNLIILWSWHFEIKGRDAIDKLELDAGYIREELEVDGQRVIMYIFEKVENNVEVTGGDWIEFFGK